MNWFKKQKRKNLVRGNCKCQHSNHLRHNPTEAPPDFVSNTPNYTELDWKFDHQYCYCFDCGKKLLLYVHYTTPIIYEIIDLKSYPEYTRVFEIYLRKEKLERVLNEN